jgi:hypothetical protein
MVMSPMGLGIKDRYVGEGQQRFSSQSIISLKKETPWFESATELYRPNDRRLSAK